MKRLAIAFFLLLCFMTVFAEAALPPAPQPLAQFFDNAGKPLSGGSICTYVPGTSTVKVTYTDSTGNTANSPCVTLNSAGRAAIWLNGSYKFVVKNSSGTTLYTVDNVSSMPYTDITNMALSQWEETGITPSYVSGTSFSVSSDQTNTFTVGRRVKSEVTGGIVYSYVVSATYATGVTTVVLKNESLALDSGLSAISVGLLNPENHAIPVLPSPDAITANYTISASDIGKHLIFDDTAATSAIIATFPSATTFPSGANLWLKSTGTGTWGVAISGTIDSMTTSTLYDNDEMQVWGDGTSWYGKTQSKTAGLENTIAVTESGGKLDSGFIPDYVPGPLSYATYSVASSTQTIGAGTPEVILTLPSVISVKSGDIFLVVAQAFVTRGSTTQGTAGIEINTSGVTATLNGKSGAYPNGSSQRSFLGVNQNAVFNMTSIGVVGQAGDLQVNLYGDSDDDSSDFKGRYLYVIFLKKQ